MTPQHLRGTRTAPSKRPGIPVDPAQRLMGCLEGVIRTGGGWRARCPAHGGKSASLSLAQGDNGTLLIHCFAGCTAHNVLAAVGLTVGDLFVRRDLRTMTPAERSQLRQAASLPRWRAALEVLSLETTVLLIAANKLAEGFALNEEDLARLRMTARRVLECSEVLTDGR